VACTSKDFPVSDNVAKLPAQPEKIKIEFQLGDTLIDGVIIKPLTFSSFVASILEAQSMVNPASFEARLRRVRMQKQVVYYSGGSVVAVTAENVAKLPIPAARIVIAHLDDEEGKAGKIIRDGDGIDKAIVYELGNPIPLGQGKGHIKELEFHASTYGDIEDVLSSDMVVQQAMLLITTVGKPLGTSLALLPSWAVNMISVADGVTISREILPRFLGSPAE